MNGDDDTCVVSLVKRSEETARKHDDALRGMLEDALNEPCRSVALAVVRTDGDVVTNYWISKELGDMFKLLGAISVLHDHVMSARSETHGE